MSYETGAVKYFFKVLLFTPVPYYIFGGKLLTVLQLPLVIFGDRVVEDLLVWIVLSNLPPTSLQHLVFQTVFGALIAAISWYLAVVKRR